MFSDTVPVPTPLVEPETLAQLTRVLVNLPSPDNNVRAAAELQLNEQWVNTQPDIVLLGLAQLVSQSQEEDVSWPQCDRARQRKKCSVASSEILFWD